MSILDKDSNMEDHWSNNPRFKEQDMSTQDTGGAAFPAMMGDGYGNRFANEGMTLRDYFAAKAMQGLCSGGSTNAQEMAQAAYILADAMLKARGQ